MISSVEDDELDHDLPEGPSKSQLKRDHRALQDLAKHLSTLPAGELDRLELGGSTRDAIAETARIKDHRALPRHFKRIANLLEREDTTAIGRLIEDRAALDRDAIARERQVEQWRERLIEGGDAELGQFIEAFPEVDRQALRALVRTACRDRGQGKPDGPRKLLRTLRKMIDATDRQG